MQMNCMLQRLRKLQAIVKLYFLKSDKVENFMKQFIRIEM